MTITLELWQIVGLIALILLAVGILKHSVIQTVLARILHWCKRIQNGTNRKGPESNKTVSSVKASATWSPAEDDPEFAQMYPNLVGNMGDSGQVQATGIVPGGVSWTLDGSRKLSTKNQGAQRIWKRKKGSK
ncbi:membrane protein [Mycobacterium phage Cuke]|uniref:Uncharacterized protein n=1 Tax=Mycobacterium phage Cuke TaxID=2079417 RepID=A0A2L1IX11_9CAUD|nr:membrane protein [Mycobacterium phage Cuke]AVD99727.1 hypothetical protein SEA_CUKE_111 [Mycobacterium phage Cuke]